MEIQSIHGSTKTTAATTASSEEDTASTASGFAALLSMVGSQFKATLGIGMDPVVIKTDADPEAVRAPEPREAKPRPERSDEKDAKAKPAKDENEEGETQADETAAADEQNSETTDAGADAQAGQEQAAQAAVAAVVDAALIAQTTTVAPVVVAETVAVAAVETVSADVEAVVTQVVAADTNVKAAETVVDVKAAVQTEVKVAEKVVAPEAVVKDTARVQQAISAYAPTQSTDDVEAVAVEAETTTVDTKAAAKDNAVRTLEVRSAAAQEQANNLARLLGSENRIQVQVNVNAAHTAKQAVADVSIYNIYAGYSAADAISLANGQFGQAEQSPTQTQPQAQTAAPRANEALPQAVVLPQPAQAPGATNAQTSAPARAEGLAPVAVQASASSGGAATANQNFSAFAQSGQSNAAQQTQQAAQPNPTERPAATAQYVIDQIKVNITKAAKAGLDRVTIQLKPVELGRIEIKLEMSEDHKVRVTVTADTKDTLSLLQTDSRTLERTLNDAGLRTDANNLHFNLRSESDTQSAEGQNGQRGKNGGSATNEAAGEELPSSFDYAAAANARGGVDTFA